MTSPFVLDPNAGAAAALTGDEVVPIMQGGYPKQTTAQAIANLVSSSFVPAGAYGPTITPNGGTTAAAPTDWVWTRSGTGVAGDVVRVSGKLAAERGVIGQGVITFDLPFEADPITSSVVASAVVLADGSVIGVLAGLDDANTGSLTIEDLDTNTLIQIDLSFQVA